MIFEKLQTESVQLYKKNYFPDILQKISKILEHSEMVTSEIGFFPPSAKSKKRKLDEVSLYVSIHTTYDLLVSC